MAILKSHAGTRVGYSNVPNEGPLSISYPINFASASSYSTNIVDFLSKGDGFPGLSCIQSLWIDNSQNSNVLAIYFSQTNQTLYIPAQTQGYYPVLSPEKGTIIFSSSGSEIVNVSILNFLAEESQWYPYGGSTSILGVVNVNVEGNTYTGGYLNTLDATLAAIKGSTTAANSLPVYQTNLPSIYPITGSVNVIGQTYNGGYLNTQDSTLAAIKGTETQANSIPSYITNNPVNNIYYSSFVSLIPSQQLIIANTGVGIIINSVLLFFGVGAYYTSNVSQTVYICDSYGNTVYISQIMLPTSSPISTATNSVQIQTFLSLTNQNAYIIGGLYLKWTTGGTTAGGLNVQITYRQSNGN